MLIQDATVVSNNIISEGTFLLEVNNVDKPESLQPGQFFNIQVSNSFYPLLRRPFSICQVENDSIFFMYKIVGEGTEILSKKTKGETINLLGPLGNNFTIDESIDHLIIIGGGIGIAPFPFLISRLNSKLDYKVLFGVRNKEEAHSYGMQNVVYSSDDGSIGLHGNVIDLLKVHLDELEVKKIKIVACGPNPMFKALKEFTEKREISCDVSMESAMACGFGICQGCPIEYRDEDNYKLICKDGPIFNLKDIEI